VAVVAVVALGTAEWSGVAWAMGAPKAVAGAEQATGIGLAAALQSAKLVRTTCVSVGLLIGLGFFCAAESAIMTLWPWKVRELAEKEEHGNPFELINNDVTRFLTSILIGTTVTSIAATALLTDVALQIWGQQGMTYATVALTLVMLLLCEIMPKSVAVQHATAVSRFVIRPIALLSIILYPVGRAVTLISNALLSTLGVGAPKAPFVTEGELKLVLSGAAQSGVVSQEEQDVIEDVLELRSTPVRAVLTPLVEVVCIPADATLNDLRELWRTCRYSRIPVYEERVDNIVGVAYALDLINHVTADGDAQQTAERLDSRVVKESADTPYFIPETMNTWELLRSLRLRKQHMAVVVNEHGGIVGIVTLEDVIEEIIGEIDDEMDTTRESFIEEVRENAWEVNCRAPLEELAKTLGVVPPESSAETTAGFCNELFGYLPKPTESRTVALMPVEEKEEQSSLDEEHVGDVSDGSSHGNGNGSGNGSREFSVDAELNFRVTILEATERRVEKVEVTRLQENDDNNEDAQRNETNFTFSSAVPEITHS